METNILMFLIGAALGALVIDLLATKVDRDRQYLIELLKADLEKRAGKK